MNSIQFILPPSVCVSPNKINGRSFWAFKKVKADCAKALKQWEAEHPEHKGWVPSSGMTYISIVARGCRPKDFDNMVAGCKAIIDCLRYSGYITNDDPTKLTCIEAKSLKVGKRKDECLVIELTYD